MINSQKQKKSMWSIKIVFKCKGSLQTWLSNPLGKLLLTASLTKLETELVARPRPNIPLFNVFAVLRLLLALVEVAPEAPEALRLATAANVSSSEAADGSGLAARLGTLRSLGTPDSGTQFSVRLGTLTLVSLSVSGRGACKPRRYTKGNTTRRNTAYLIMMSPFFIICGVIKSLVIQLWRWWRGAVRWWGRGCECLTSWWWGRGSHQTVTKS